MHHTRFSNSRSAIEYYDVDTAVEYHMSDCDVMGVTTSSQALALLDERLSQLFGMR